MRLNIYIALATANFGFATASSCSVSTITNDAECTVFCNGGKTSTTFGEALVVCQCLDTGITEGVGGTGGVYSKGDGWVECVCPGGQQCEKEEAAAERSEVLVDVYDCGGNGDNLFTGHPYCFYDGNYTNPTNLTFKAPLLASNYEGMIKDESLDPTAVSFYNNVRTILDYLWTAHGIDSWDGMGGAVTAAIHIGPPGGASAINDGANIAYFATSYFGEDNPTNLIAFGDNPNGTSWATALDLVAHEFSHGMYWAFALKYFPYPFPPEWDPHYRDEPQALNEHFADVLAALVDKHSGKSQEEVWSTFEDLYAPREALRYMNNPALKNDTDWYPERPIRPTDQEPDYATNQDGWVYKNAGIGNLVFYLLSEGGVHPNATKAAWTGISVEGIGTGNASKIWFAALQHCLSPGATYPQLRFCTEEFSGDFRDNVGNAWDAVGLTDIQAPEGWQPPTSSPSSSTPDNLGTIPVPESSIPASAASMMKSYGLLVAMAIAFVSLLF